MNQTSTMNSNVKVNVNHRQVKLLSARGMTVMAILSVMATILMLFDIPMWFAPSFYQVDFSEVPVLIGAFALGPVAGIVIELLKILINLVINGTDTAMVGETANFIVGCALVVPSAIIYHMKKTKKAALLGMIVGTVVFIVTGCLLNAYILLPTYAKIYGMPIDALIGMGTAVNPAIDGMMTFVLFAVAPFNIIKGVAVSIVTIILYKYVSPLIKGYHR
jgi:riboflavin transporter FmnP